jgi:hypothetical protein
MSMTKVAVLCSKLGVAWLAMTHTRESLCLELPENRVVYLYADESPEVWEARLLRKE